jgi:hypothetical protein
MNYTKVILLDSVVYLQVLVCELTGLLDKFLGERIGLRMFARSIRIHQERWLTLHQVLQHIACRAKK